MGFISKKFARAFCADEEERKEKDRAMKDELAQRMQERREARRLEKEKMRLLPEETKRNLKCAKIFLGALSPLAAAAVIWNLWKGLACAGGTAVILSAAIFASRWRKMTAMPFLGAAAGIIIGLVARLIWRV